jgi:hypothetical protein
VLSSFYRRGVPTYESVLNLVLLVATRVSVRVFVCGVLYRPGMASSCDRWSNYFKRRWIWNITCYCVNGQ